jgi:hypothetical protein
MAELLPAARKPAPLDATITVALICVGVVAAIMAILAGIASGASMALGIAVGGLVATLNLWMFAYVGRGVLAGGSRGKLWALVGAVKFLALFGGVWLLLKAELTSPLTLAIGYGALPLGITVAAFLRRGEDDGPAQQDGFGAGVPAENLVPASPEAERKEQ